MKITVIGSINTDFVVTSDRRPSIGETIQGDSFETTFGGKGANQAVASARLGVDTAMIGAVGDDEFGELLIDNLEKNDISSKYVEQIPQTSSGTSVITIAEGDNSIIYVPGANEQLHPGMIDRYKNVLTESDIVVLQNEVTDEVIHYVIDYCHKNQIQTILNPAPARLLDEKYIDKVTYLTPNETEFKLIFQGQKMETMLQQYPNKLIITLGAEGVIYNNGTKNVKVPAFNPEKAIDTTGAGDTFNGAFAVGVVSGLSIKDSIKFANLASSISIQKSGAQVGMPLLKEMKESQFYEEKWNIE